jgi:hypothetical protein
MDTSENSVAHRNFTALAEAARTGRDLTDALSSRVALLEQIVAQQDVTINELRGLVYASRGTGATA